MAADSRSGIPESYRTHGRRRSRYGPSAPQLDTPRASPLAPVVAQNGQRVESVVLAVAAPTHWHIPGTILDGPATDVADARRRAARTLLRADVLLELPADSLSADPAADGRPSWATGP